MRAGVHPASLKLELAARGAVLDATVRDHGALFRGTTGTTAVARSLDLVLPDETWVSAPVEERTTAGSPFHLLVDGERFFLVRRELDGAETLRVEVRAVPQPRFYERRTTRGTPMWRVAAVHGSHLVINPAGACGFSLRGAPCRFCVEGARGMTERDAVPVEDVLETVRAAFDEGAAEFVYFNSAFFDAEDGGIGFLTPYIEAVRRHFDTLIATQVHPPRANHWIDRTYAMGVDALSYNLEIFDADVLQRHCVGRARYIGRERYLEALAYAAEVFPSGTVWTELVMGLEPPASTIRGIDALTAMSVVPVLGVFRGGGAPAADVAASDPAELASVLAHLYRAVKERRINMGWMRDLAFGVTPLEARHLAGDEARLAVAVQQLTRSRLGALAARSLARFRRRLRVRTVSESFESSHL